MAQPDGVMSVRADLVREHLVAQLHEEALQRYPGEIAAPVAAELKVPLDRIGGLQRASALPPATLEMASALARLGYHGRIAETELFPHAAARVDWLSAALARLAPPDEDGDSWPATGKLCGELASEEPDFRPDPGPGAPPSWRIPGPGGHVRHYLAVGAAADRGPKDRNGNPSLPEGIYEIGELKRCWLYGFLVRCCEEIVTSRGLPDRR